MTPFAAALMSSFLWAIGTQLFAHSGRKMPIRKLNLIKSVIGLVCFSIHCSLVGGFQIETETLGWALISGFLGFGLGDLLIFTAYARMGPARTMILGSFQPAMVAVMAFFAFGKVLEAPKLLGLALMIFCVWLLSKDKSKRRQVDWKILGIALAGLALEAAGLLCSKQAFIVQPSLSSETLNFYRILSVFPLLLAMNYKKQNWETKLFSKDNVLVAISAFFATYVGLFFYLYAISQEDAAVVVSIGLVTMFLASIYEHIRDRERPSAYFLAASVLMILALKLLRS